MSDIQTPGVGEFLTLDDYLELCHEQGPALHLRGAAGVLRDMLAHYGHIEEVYCGKHIGRPRFFDGEALGFGEYKFVGGTDMLADLEMTIRGLAIPGSDRVVIIFKGPPSAGKSILAEMITKGLIQFSHEEDGGALYTHRFVLPGNLEFGSARSSVGFSSKLLPDFKALDERGNIAKENLTIECEMHNSPIRMLPRQYRLGVFKDIFGIPPEDIQYAVPEAFREECCHNCEGILNALISIYAKEHTGSNKERRQKALHNALHHVVVQRYGYNTAGKGIVTVPVNERLRVGDAIPITDHSKYSKIAQVLDYLGVRFLGYRGSDHVAANNGVLILEEILQRQDVLTGNENDFISRGKLRLGSVSLLCDTVVLGTTNIEPYLAAITSDQVNPGAKTRWSIRSVMHPIRISDAVGLYERTILHPKLLSRKKHVSPHTTWSLAFWGVTSRLENPSSSLMQRGIEQGEDYTAEEKEIVENLTIPQKAYLYDGDVINAEVPHDLERYVTDRFIAKLWKRSWREGEPLPTRVLRSGIVDSALRAPSSCLLPTDIFDAVEGFLAKLDNITDPFLVRNVEKMPERINEMRGFLAQTRLHTSRLVRLDVEHAIVSEGNDENTILDLLVQYMTIASQINKGETDEVPHPKVPGTKVDPRELLSPFEDILFEGGWWDDKPDDDELLGFRYGLIDRFSKELENYREARGADYHPTMKSDSRDDLFYRQVFRDVISTYIRGAMADPIKWVLQSRNSILSVVENADALYDVSSGLFDASRLVRELDVAPHVMQRTAAYLNGMLALHERGGRKDSAQYCRSCAPAFFGYAIKENLLLESIPVSRRKQLKLNIEEG